MSYTEQEYLNMSTDEYNPSIYNHKIGGKLVTASTSGTSYENNGLQASVIKIDNQTVVAFRNSQSMGR